RSHALDLEPLAGDADVLEQLDRRARQPLRQVDQGVIVADDDLPDVAALEPGLVGHRAHDVARLDAVRVADFDAVGDEPGRRRATGSARVARGSLAGLRGLA